MDYHSRIWTRLPTNEIGYLVYHDRRFQLWPKESMDRADVSQWFYHNQQFRPMHDQSKRWEVVNDELSLVQNEQIPSLNSLDEDSNDSSFWSSPDMVSICRPHVRLQAPTVYYRTVTLAPDGGDSFATWNYTGTSLDQDGLYWLWSQEWFDVPVFVIKTGNIIRQEQEETNSWLAWTDERLEWSSSPLPLPDDVLRTLTGQWVSTHCYVESIESRTPKQQQECACEWAILRDPAGSPSMQYTDPMCSGGLPKLALPPICTDFMTSQRDTLYSSRSSRSSRKSPKAEKETICEPALETQLTSFYPKQHSGYIQIWDANSREFFSPRGTWKPICSATYEWSFPYVYHREDDRWLQWNPSTQQLAWTRWKALATRLDNVNTFGQLSSSSTVVVLLHSRAVLSTPSSFSDDWASCLAILFYVCLALLYLRVVWKWSRRKNERNFYAPQT